MKRKSATQKLSGNQAISATDMVWSIEDIIDGPKYETFNGKKRKLYKVRWSETYELASNIPSELIEIFEKREKKEIKILGPLVENKAGECDPNDNELELNAVVPLTKSKFAVDIGGEISFMNYKQVKDLYKDELLEYFEERAKIEEEKS